MKSIPKSLTLNTGEQHKVSKTIDDFFKETRDFCLESYDLHIPQFTIVSRNLVNECMNETNDRITYLEYRGLILAGVLETRTEFNFVRYTFFRDTEAYEQLAQKKE